MCLIIMLGKDCELYGLKQQVSSNRDDMDPRGFITEASEWGERSHQGRTWGSLHGREPLDITDPWASGSTFT